MTAVARLLHRSWAGSPADHVTLDYEGRMVRRRTLVTGAGRELLVDLPETVSLEDGDAFETLEGALIVVRAAEETLVEVTGEDLARLAWHIGNRHKPAQIERCRILLQRDHVLEDMLGRLGARLRVVAEPFRPEGGAYGHGRTMGHAHDHGP